MSLLIIDVPISHLLLVLSCEYEISANVHGNLHHGQPCILRIIDENGIKQRFSFFVVLNSGFTTPESGWVARYASINVLQTGVK